MNPIADLGRAHGSLAANAIRFDARTVQTQLGRSILALAQGITLGLTSWPNLTAQVLGRPAAGYCDGVRSISLFCLGSSTPNEIGRWLGIAIALLVVLGLYPRCTAVLHAWLAISINVSLSLPDGGEAVAVFSTILIMIVLAADNRVNGWSPLRRHQRFPTLAALSYAGSLALCLQLAGIYFESGLAKLAVEDWVNGSAMFYITRDPMFGGSGVVGAMMQWLSGSSWGTALLTWGTIFLEVAIGVLILAPAHVKKYALCIVLLLHVGIAITMGLWSFALIMIGTAVVAAYTVDPRDHSAADRDSAGEGLASPLRGARMMTSGEEVIP